MSQQQVLRYGAVILGLPLYVVYVAVHRLLSEDAPLGVPPLGPTILARLLLVLAGALLAWGMREPSALPRRFDPIAFLIFTALPLWRAVQRILYIFMTPFPLPVVLFPYLMGALLAYFTFPLLLGFGLIFAFRSRPTIRPYGSNPRTVSQAWRQIILRYVAALLGMFLFPLLVVRAIVPVVSQSLWIEQPHLLAVHLLPLLPGVILGWGLREPSSLARRFDPVAFVIYSVLPLLVNILPWLGQLFVYFRPVRSLIFQMRYDAILNFLPEFALIAGIGLVCSFRVGSPRLATSPEPLPLDAPEPELG